MTSNGTSHPSKHVPLGHLESDRTGPVSAVIGDRPPFGAMRQLSHDELRAEQVKTLASPRRRASIDAKILFATMDALYGTPRTLEKFRVLELIARVPYQAWENVGYVAMTHTAHETSFARRIFDQVRVSRFEQDNEQWHLLILEEMLEATGTRLGFFKHRVIPQVIAFVYYQLSWFLYALRPDWSYRLNADFEDHAEHEYALLVTEHPEWEDAPFESAFLEDYGEYASVADLFRQISFDERMHKDESTASMRSARYR